MEGCPVRRLASLAAPESSGTRMRSAPSHPVPRSRLSAAPLARYWAEKRAAAITANAMTIARFRYGRFLRFRTTSLKKLNRGASFIVCSVSGTAI